MSPSAWLLLLTPLAAPSPQETIQAPSGEAVFARYCARCHGPEGRGDGALSPLLRPAPLDLSWARFKLVSGTNRAPTDEDLLRTIERGMPGTPMPPFDHLPLRWRKAVVEHVRTLAAEGYAGRLIGDTSVDVDAAEIEDVVVERLYPRAAIVPPPADLALDRQDEAWTLYTRHCLMCHGGDGRGNDVAVQVDEFGRASLPRDFVGGIFKGGSDFGELYKRMLLGVPGTAMPATALDRGEAAVLARHVQELAGADVLPDAPRALVAAPLEVLPDDIDHPSWRLLSRTELPLYPLDWRKEPAYSVGVRIAHDGESLAVRLDWSSLAEFETTPGAVVHFSDARHPAYLQPIPGSQHDVCAARLPAGLPADLGAAFRITPTMSTLSEETATVVLVRPLTASDGYAVDLRPGTAPRWIQFQLALGEPTGAGDAMSAWLPLRF